MSATRAWKGIPAAISGAKKAGVPAVRLVMSEAASRRELPKSVMRTWPSTPNRRLSGLRSP